MFHFSAVGKGKAVALPAKSVGQQVNDLLKSSSAYGKAAEGRATAGAADKDKADKAADSETTLSLSQEAQKLLDEKKEAERERMQRAVQEMREKTSSLAETQKSSKQSYLNQKIADAKERLKVIVEMMRTALLMGDKRLAAVLAKDAAQIAKELAAAVRAAAGGPAEAGEVIAVPQVISDGEPQEGAGQAAGAESLSLQMMEAPGAEGAQGEVGAEVEPKAEAEVEAMAAEAKAAAAAAAAEAQGTEEGDRAGGADGKNEATEKDKKEKLAAILSVYKNEIKVRLGELASRALSGATQGPHSAGLSPDQKRAIAEIKLLLKTIISMAKGTLKRGADPLGGAQTPAPMEERAAKDIEGAEKDIEKAIKVMDEAA